MSGTRNVDGSRWSAARPLLVGVLAVSMVLSATGAATATAGGGLPPGAPPAVDAPDAATQAIATVCSFEGRDVSGDTIALTSFQVTAPSDPPADGQVVSATFVLANVGQTTRSLDSVLLRAETPAGTQAFGTVSSVTLDPGETYAFETDVLVTEGDWQLWPAYVTANGQSSPSPWQPCEFTVVPPDTEPPAVSIDLDPDSTIADDETLTITGTATDPSGIGDVRVVVDGTTVATCTGSPCSATVGPFEPGTYAYRVEAVDGAGNLGTAGSTFDVAATASPLSVEVDAVVPPPNTSLPTVIAARAVGDAAVASLTIVVDGEAATTCAAPTCGYEARFAPGSEHTIGAVVEDTAGRFAESAGGIEDAVVEIPSPTRELPPVVVFREPVGTRAFDADGRLAFSVVSGDPIRRVRLFGLGETVSDYRTLCGPNESVPACPDHALEFDEAVTFDPGYNAFAVTVDTAGGLHVTARKDVRLTDPATIQTSVNATHAPFSPAPGEAVDLRATVETEWDVAAISSLELRQLSFGGPDEVLESCSFERFVPNASCEATYAPPDGRHVIYYYAVATVAGDREVTSAPRPVVFDDGPDGDDDGLTDFEESYFCTDERNPDTDGDALLDGWEVYGHHFPDGHVVDLPAMGAHPCQRDVFLEVDWWGNATHSHEPAPYSLTMVKQAFRRGGIRLHVDDGKWGGGEETPHHDLLSGFPPDYYYENGYEYRLRKAAHFDPHRLWTFHYAVFRHRTGRSAYMHANSVNIQVSDTADWYFEASELFHEFGHSIGMGHGGREGTRVQRRNGDLVTYYGRWDGAPNRKPNYLSGMNYAYYGATYWNAAEGTFVASYDYSRADLPTLNESDLDERPDSDFARALRDYPLPESIAEAPPGVADDWVPVVRYGCVDPDETIRVFGYEYQKSVVMISDGRRTLARKVAGEPWQMSGLPAHDPGIDWNCDGRIEDSVAMNVNGDGGDGGLLADRTGFTWGEVLEGRADWSRLPNRHPCPGDQQTERPIPGTDDTYEVAPAPSNAYLAAGHDPPCDSVTLAPDDRGRLPVPGPGADVPAPAPPERAHKPIWEEAEALPPMEFCDGLDTDGDGEVDEGCPDADDDGYTDEMDNCPFVANPRQVDTDGDFVGDACGGLPPAPDDLAAERTDAGVRLSWTPVEGASGYAVWRQPSTDAPLEYVGGYPTTATATFVDGSVDPDRSATYVVRAVNAMTGAEGRAASVAYEPDDAGRAATAAARRPGLGAGGPATLLAAILVAVAAIAGAASYVRRRTG